MHACLSRYDLLTRALAHFEVGPTLECSRSLPVFPVGGRSRMATVARCDVLGRGRVKLKMVLGAINCL